MQKILVTYGKDDSEIYEIPVDLIAEVEEFCKKNSFGFKPID